MLRGILTEEKDALDARDYPSRAVVWLKILEREVVNSA
jgi:hypothetical protein